MAKKGGGYISLSTFQALCNHGVGTGTPANDNEPPRKKPGPKPGHQYAIRQLTGERLYKRPRAR